MRTKNEIEYISTKIKESKEASQEFDSFGNPKHLEYDAMIWILDENTSDTDCIYNRFGDEIAEVAIVVAEWLDGDITTDELIEIL